VGNLLKSGRLRIHLFLREINAGVLDGCLLPFGEIGFVPEDLLAEELLFGVVVGEFELDLASLLL
jgi:hypothetical protein